MIPLKFSHIGKLLLIGMLALVQSQAQTEKDTTAKGNSAAQKPSSAADEAWQDLMKSVTITPPKEWQQQQPSREMITKFREEQSGRLVAASDKARSFYQKYPNDPRAGDAKDIEIKALESATSTGNKEANQKLEALLADRLKDPSITEDQRFEIRAKSIQRHALSKMSEGPEAMFAEFEKGVRILQKDFPKRPEIYEMLMGIASQAKGEKAKAIAQEIVDSTAPDQIKQAAKGLLKKMDLLNKPLDLKFSSIKGEEIDLSKMKGKVVLIDFWATWCGPCIAELPNVKKAYEKLHPDGFEILGISFDQDKNKLESFLSKEKMTWPQYFDGEGWGNKIGQEFGINSIPTMWLVDKKGNVRDLEAREDLESKVIKLLAEE